jgi:AraC-like DNA-binding protein
MSATSKNVHPAAPLLHALQDCILPGLEWNALAHVVIAQKNRKLLKLPPGVRALPLELRGRRVAVRHPGKLSRAVSLSAKWPQDNMQELRIPRIIAVVAGSAGLRMGDYVLQCPAGTVIFLPPGVPQSDNAISHLETLPPDVRECTLFWITPMISGLACRMCHTKGEKHWNNAQGETLFLHLPRVSQLFYMLAETVEEVMVKGKQADTFDVPVLESVLLALIRTVARDIYHEQFLLQDVPPHEIEGHDREDDPIQQAMQFLKTHYPQPLVLDDVARRFFLSRAQFTRKFRERTGQSFLEFLNERRLDQAVRLLHETDWTVGMIAKYIGFASPAHFHQLFFRKTGLTPIQFRKQAQERK